MHLGQMLEQSAARFGDSLAVAVLADDSVDTHTFRSLDAASNRVANGLLEAGIGHGDPVALMARNSTAFVETLFATQKIGAPVTPVNVRFDPSDVGYVLDDADPRAVVVDAEFADQESVAARFEAHDCPVYVVGDSDAFSPFGDLTETSAAPPRLSVDEDTVEGYFYTSGSTGRPKGVVHRHRDRVFANMNVIAEFGLRRSDVNCTPLPLFHSGPLYTGFMPFVQFGVPSIVFRTFDPETVLETIDEWNATVLGGVPAQYRRLAAAADGEYDLDSLRFWWVSGAPMPADLREQCRETLCERFSSVYGATEIGPPVTTLPPEECDERPTSVGTGHMGQEVRVVEPDGDVTDRVPTGAVGELVVRGESVMDRYLNRPDQTADSLVDGWYFTGDLARRDDDRYLYIEGRTDELIISGGENIYPAEVADVILDHEDVEDAAVIGVEHDEWGETPKAFVVAAADLDADAVVEHCLESDLADYKRPRAVAFVPEIPRNPSGGSVLTDELRRMD